jgi:hypothetical protein
MAERIAGARACAALAAHPFPETETEDAGESRTRAQG